MRPSGDGDRETSRTAPESFEFGDRYPLEVLPLLRGGDAGILGFDRRFREEAVGLAAALVLRDPVESDPSSVTPE